LTDLVLNLDPARFAVGVACATRRDSGFADDIRQMRDRGVPVFIVDMHREIRPPSDARAFLRLVALMRGGRYDVVHTHSSKAGFLGRMAASVARVPHVVHTPHVFAFQMDTGKLLQRFYLLLERVAARATDRIICVSTEERDVALRMGLSHADAFRVVPNGIDGEAYANTGDAASSLRRRMGLRDDDFVFGSVGRFSEQKGFAFLLQAGQRVLERNPRARLLLVGEGEKDLELRASSCRLGLGDRCIITADNRSDRGIYSTFDLFAMPSLWEGMPYALLEAMASARPIVATRVGGMREAIVSERSGILVPSGNSEDLAAAMIRIMEDRRLAAKLGAAAREVVLTRYRVTDMVRQTSAIYESWLDPEAMKLDNAVS
jgi:glycosyltransferase involved in cell wall biosynthesis